MRDGVLIYNCIFNELPFKTVSGDVTAFHRIEAVNRVLETQLQVCENFN